jgi:transcriptional regulator with XRE-family HTH domain
MSNTTSLLLPSTAQLLQQFGERLRLARLRRRLQAKQVAQRAGMTEVTLRKIEHGSPGVTIGAYAAVLQVLQLQQDFAQLAEADPLGRRLQDIEGEGGMRPRRKRRAAPNMPAGKTGMPLTARQEREQSSAETSSSGVTDDDLYDFLTSLPADPTPGHEASDEKK